jgi:uncharacterized membrane protein YfcA
MRWTVFVAGVQMIVAIYGGYFGAGIGILMLAGLAFAGLDDIHQMNAMKVLLQTMINGVASIIFLFSRSWTGSSRCRWRWRARVEDFWGSQSRARCRSRLCGQ